VSVGGGFLAWTLLAAESLFTPAGGGVMPAGLAQTNAHGVPANALWLTNAMVQVFLLLTLFWKASYLALISLSTAMILLPYLFSAVYALSLAWRDNLPLEGRRTSDAPVAALATIYCAWLLYAAGLKYLLLSAVLYAPGALLYLMARRLRHPAFVGGEKAVLAGLLLLAAVAVGLLATGRLSL